MPFRFGMRTPGLGGLVNNRGEYYFDGLYWVIDHCFDGGGLVVKLLGGDEAVIVVKVLKDGWDE